MTVIVAKADRAAVADKVKVKVKVAVAAKEMVKVKVWEKVKALGSAHSKRTKRVVLRPVLKAGLVRARRSLLEMPTEIILPVGRLHRSLS